MKRLSYLIILLVALASCNVKNDDPESFMQSFQIKELSPEQFYHIIYFQDTVNFVLIDLRDPHTYALGHLPNAINIPSKSLLKKWHKDVLNSDAIKVFYSDDPSFTRLSVTVAKRAGYKNCYALLGTYESLRNNFVKNFAIRSAFYDDEKPDFNYKDKFAELAAGGGTPTTQSQPKVSVQVPVKKKQVGGGCE